MLTVTARYGWQALGLRGVILTLFAFRPASVYETRRTCVPVLTMPHSHKATPKLTPRERDLVRGITRGHSNREIASELGISEQTVKNQLTVVFQKLHIKNRLELAVYAMRFNLNR